MFRIGQQVLVLQKFHSTERRVDLLVLLTRLYICPEPCTYLPRTKCQNHVVTNPTHQPAKSRKGASILHCPNHTQFARIEAAYLIRTGNIDASKGYMQSYIGHSQTTSNLIGFIKKQY